VNKIMNTKSNQTSTATTEGSNPEVHTNGKEKKEPMTNATTTMSVAKEIIGAAMKSKWFMPHWKTGVDELVYGGTKEFFENDSNELISSKYSIWTTASRKKVFDRFLEVLDSIGATYDEPDICYEEKVRYKKISDRPLFYETIFYEVFEDAKVNVSLGGFPKVRVLVCFETGRLDVFVSLMEDQ
jgi:hypothetical protein